MKPVWTRRPRPVLRSCHLLRLGMVDAVSEAASILYTRPKQRRVDGQRHALTVEGVVEALGEADHGGDRTREAHPKVRDAGRPRDW